MYYPNSVSGTGLSAASRGHLAPNLFLACLPVWIPMKEDITLVEIPPMHVLGIRRRGNYRIIPELLGKIF
jgi:hypothetical protein